jgi:hypothetical protein
MPQQVAVSMAPGVAETVVQSDRAAAAPGTCEEVRVKTRSFSSSSRSTPPPSTPTSDARGADPLKEGLDTFVASRQLLLDVLTPIFASSSTTPCR